MNRISLVLLTGILTCMLDSTPLSAQSFWKDTKRAFSNIFGGKIDGSGKVVSETRSFSAFHTVRVDAPFGVEVDAVESAQPSVFVQADDNLLPLISTTLKDGILTVSLDDETSAQSLNSKNIRVVVSAPSTERVELRGAGSVDIRRIQKQNFSLMLYGVGSLDAAGTVETLNIEAEGVGSVSARHVRARNVKVSSHGVGSTSVFATDNLTVDISGIGSLVYYGNPPNVSKRAGGIGSISKGSSSFQP